MDTSTLPRWAMVAIALTLLGCPLGDDDDVVGDDDTEGDDDTAGDDDADLPADDDTAPDLMELQFSYRWEDGSSRSSVRAGRMIDVDGDGVVGPGDPMQLWLHVEPTTPDGYLALVGHDGTVHQSIEMQSFWEVGTLGELDSDNPGLEFLTLDDWYILYSSVELFGAGGTLWSHSYDREPPRRLWLTDLEGDGHLELLLGKDVVDAHSGALLRVLQGFGIDESPNTVAADLDLDGRREIISMTEDDPQKIRLHDDTGAVIETCWTGHWPSSHVAYAVGDLDGDPEGEFAVALMGFVVQCDSDGTLLREAQVQLSNPAMLGLGQLDDDPLPELVVADSFGIVALDTDLTPLWTYNPGPQPWSTSLFTMALADLDGDGRHEIVTHRKGTVAVIDDDGELLASLEEEFSYAISWNAPAIIDIDADGLAEIVVTGWPGFAIIENPYGGWLVPGADEPWPGIDKHPGDRTVDGGIPDPLDVHWAEPWTNVWQGLPAWP